jgi:hypothetical protein
MTTPGGVIGPRRTPVSILAANRGGKHHSGDRELYKFLEINASSMRSSRHRTSMIDLLFQS